MNDNGLSNVISLIKKQKWENLFKRRELMHTAACKEFYANLTVFIYKKKEIARSRVKGVEIEFDNTAASLRMCLVTLGESGSGEKFYDAEDEIQGPAVVVEDVPAVAVQASAQQKETTPSGADPSGQSGHLPESEMLKLQAEFERTRDNRFQADLEKAQAKNARLLALLDKRNPTSLNLRISIAKPTGQTLIIFCTKPSLTNILIFDFHCTKHFHCSF
ncbi:hypothetical protein Dimus_031625 [Dionaea muscipula]